MLYWIFASQLVNAKVEAVLGKGGRGGKEEGRGRRRGGEGGGEGKEEGREGGGEGKEEGGRSLLGFHKVIMSSLSLPLFIPRIMLRARIFLLKNV